MRQFLACGDIFIPAPFYLGYVWAAARFCKTFLGSSRKKELLFVAVSFVGWIFLNLAARRYHFPHFFRMVAGQGLFMMLVLLFFGENWEKRTLAASILLLVTDLGANILTPVLSCGLLFFRHTVAGVAEPFFNEWEIMAIDCACYCFVAYVNCWVSGHLGPVFGGKPGKWYATLALPLIMLLLLSDLAGQGASHGIMLRSGGSAGLYYDQLFSHIGCFVLAALSALAAGFYVFGMNRIYLEQEKGGRYQAQVAVYKMLAEQHRQSQRLHHDMKNHIIALSGLFQDQDWEKLGEYLDKLRERGLGEAGELTGNRAVDALLCQKRQLAEAENIKWDCDVHIPKECGIDAFDLCVIFGNILDNGLEACRRMKGGESRFIHIQGQAVKQCFLITARNSVDRVEEYRGGGTKKKNPQEHGIGLQNVVDVARGYHGTVGIEAGEGVFQISILMPFPKPHIPHMTSEKLFET